LHIGASTIAKKGKKTCLSLSVKGCYKCFQSKLTSEKILPAPKALKAFCCCFSLQLCGVRGGGEAASQAMFWRPRNDLSLVLAFESTRERNTAIMLARRFAVDCNVRAFAKHHHHQSRSAATFFSSHLNEMVADHPCWARRQNSLVMAPVLLCQSPPLLTIRDSHSLLAPVPLIFLPRQSGSVFKASPRRRLGVRAVV
jgi:hypothetical protein